MRKKLIIVLLSIFSLCSFALVSKFEDRAFMRTIDVTVTVKIQDAIDKSSRVRLAAFVGNVMEGAGVFASPEFTVIMTLLLTGIVFRRNKWALLIPVLLTLLVAAEIYGKSVVHHPAPPFSMIKHPTTIFPANYINEQFSYPSGHAARAIFMALVVWFLVKKRLIIACVLGAYVLLVSVSRIYLGHHWFSDVVGGLLLGCAMGLISTAATRFR